MSNSDKDNRRQSGEETEGRVQLKNQLKGVAFLFLCFVLGFLVTFALVKII